MVPVLVLLAYPAYLLLMAGVLRIVGARRSDIVKWALRQADRQRLVELVRAVRGTAPPDTGNSRPTPGTGAGADARETGDPPPNAIQE